LKDRPRKNRNNFASPTSLRCRFCSFANLGKRAYPWEKAFAESKADFADGLLGQKNLQAGCQYTATLDDAASATDGYKHLLS
jgi:hypothetical protein